MASIVLPEPVAIWIERAGPVVVKDFSRFVIASTLFGQRPGCGPAASPAGATRSVEGLVSSAAVGARATARLHPARRACRRASHSARVSGRWKGKSGRLRGSRVEEVDEERLDAGAEVEERQRARPAGSARRAGPRSTSRPGSRRRSACAPRASPRGRRRPSRRRRAGSRRSRARRPSGTRGRRRRARRVRFISSRFWTTQPAAASAASIFCRARCSGLSERRAHRTGCAEQAPRCQRPQSHLRPAAKPCAHPSWLSPALGRGASVNPCLRSCICEREHRAAKQPASSASAYDAENWRSTRLRLIAAPSRPGVAGRNRGSRARRQLCGWPGLADLRERTPQDPVSRGTAPPRRPRAAREPARSIRPWTFARRTRPSVPVKLSRRRRGLCPGRLIVEHDRRRGLPTRGRSSGRFVRRGRGRAGGRCDPVTRAARRR